MVVVIQKLGTTGQRDVLAQACSSSSSLLQVWGDVAEGDQNLGPGDLKYLFEEEF